MPKKADGKGKAAGGAAGGTGPVAGAGAAGAASGGTGTGAVTAVAPQAAVVVGVRTITYPAWYLNLEHTAYPCVFTGCNGAHSVAEGCPVKKAALKRYTCCVKGCAAPKTRRSTCCKNHGKAGKAGKA